MDKIKNEFPLYCPECGKNLYLVDVEESKKFDRFNRFTGKKNPIKYSFSLVCGRCLGSEDEISESWPPNISENSRYREDFTNIDKSDLDLLKKKTKKEKHYE